MPLNNQSGASTTVGVVATTASYAAGVTSAASYANSGAAYAGKLAGFGTLAGLAQVGVNIYDNKGDTSKLTAGDLLNIAGAMAMFVPGRQVIGVALSIGRAVYSIYEGKYDPITVQDIGDYWYEKFNESNDDYKNLNRDGKYHIYDPLVLDLDGDGIETVGTQGYAGALFDHDKDGIRTSTGWAAADDGLLVIDRNSDGLINNGGELFGDSTVLKDGSSAVHGYAALAEFDSNSDGLIDNKDEKFADLKIWRDLNQDGVSQEGELSGLAELGTQSLDAAYKDVNTRLGNGNTVAQKGSYTLSDGSKREMGDLLLANDTLHSRYTDSVALTEEQMQAANLQGIGRLRDLREAA